MSVDHSNPSVQSRVAHRLKQAGEDPMWADHAEVRKDVCSLAAGIIYGQQARIKDLERRMGEMQVTMSKMAEGWTALQSHRDLLVEALAEIKATVDGDSGQPVRDIVYGLIEELK